MELRNRETQNLRKYVGMVNPRYVWYRHCEILGGALEKVAAGDIKRLMVFEPPRHGKSEMVSRIFPGYYLRKHPMHTVGLCSYAADLAFGLSRDSRDYYQRGDRQVRQDVSATREWQTEEGGGEWAAGVGGPITGKGFHLGIIDDPLKNSEEAYSITIRSKQIQWWQSTFFTRQEPDAAIILVMTRWHEEDLAGWLLSEEETNPQNWHIIFFPALKEKVLPKFPKTCTIEYDGRTEGQALCPERYDEKLLADIKISVGTQFWNSMYQQHPTVMEGDIWKRKWFKKIVIDEKVLETLSNIGHDWDLAYTKDDTNSASAFIKAGIDQQNNICLLDLGFKWLEFPEMINWMVGEGGPHFIEKKASGKSAAQTLKKSGIFAKEVSVDGLDKVSRSNLATPAAESGHVYVSAHIYDILLDDPQQGITKFPNGPQTDLNDALVQAINRLWKRPKYGFGWLGEKKKEDEQ